MESEVKQSARNPSPLLLSSNLLRSKRMEVPSGFEPLNIGFADRPLRPLGHGTLRVPIMVPGHSGDDGSEWDERVMEVNGIRDLGCSTARL